MLLSVSITNMPLPRSKAQRAFLETLARFLAKALFVVLANQTTTSFWTWFKIVDRSWIRFIVERCQNWTFPHYSTLNLTFTVSTVKRLKFVLVTNK